MSGNTDTGGQAFPNEGFNGWGKPEEGMTLRDYFAAKAMQGMLADPNTPEIIDIAGAAYEVADAMLRARQA
jgi:hypothetical protein